MYFQAYNKNECCLCGSSDSLTGEHKIKASALRDIFQHNQMVIVGDDYQRIAQGVKSKEFHFSAPLCSVCNGARTQDADREFDRFHKIVTRYILENKNPSLVFELPEYRIDSENYLNVFRYFSKILCCHIAESHGPRVLEACQFAIKEKNHNIISLHIDEEPNYHNFCELNNSRDFASHGGLFVIFKPDACNSLLSIFKLKKAEKLLLGSSLSFRGVRYLFSLQMTGKIERKLYKFDYDFWRKCRSAYETAKTQNENIEL